MRARDTSRTSARYERSVIVVLRLADGIFFPRLSVKLKLEFSFRRARVCISFDGFFCKFAQLSTRKLFIASILVCVYTRRKTMIIRKQTFRDVLRGFIDSY